MEIPTLTTKRLVLRGFRPGDWDPYSAMNADPAVRRWLGGDLLSREQTWTKMESIMGQWALRGYGVYAIEAEGSFAGHVGILHPSDWPEPELAWSLCQAFWGRGLATEAATKVVQWAFSELRRERLVSYILPENARSQRVAAKLGGVRDNQIVLRNHLSDVWVHPAPGRGVAT